MIQLIPNADQKLKELMYGKGVRAFYNATCESYTKDYSQLFATNMQTLITKLAIIVTKVSTKPVRISYCRTAIPYLCKNVLDNPSLNDKFEELAINDNGNDGKHSADTVVVDMDRCVTTYNNIVNSIASKYNLFSLRDMVVKKNVQKHATTPTANTYDTQAQKQVAAPKVVKAQPDKNKPTKFSKPNQPLEVATTKDENLSLTVELKNGEGYYKKGVFNKTSMLNFLLHVFINNLDNFKITSVTAVFQCGNNSCEKKLSTSSSSTTKIDLDASKFSGNVKVTVTAIYKLGMFKTKQIRSTVSKTFC